MYFSESSDEWNYIHTDDLWIYNKLFLSRVLGYTCGPSGVPVPKPDFYVVRPSFNLLGMGRFSRIEWIDNSTEHLHPAEFWCEVFEGDHLSVDYQNKTSRLVVKGIKNKENPLWKWERWEKIDKIVEFPSILEKIVGDYEWINCEFIENKLIEVYFRRNSDFRYGNNVAIPIWNDKNIEKCGKYKYIIDEDYLRKGFLVD